MLNFSPITTTDLEEQIIHRKANRQKSLKKEYSSKFITQGTYLAKQPTEIEECYKLSNIKPVMINKLPNIIGEGAFSRVYLFKECKGNKYYAVKHLLKKDIIHHCNSLNSIYKEINIHSRLVHENIIRLYNPCESEEDFHLIMEYAEKGTLYKVIALSHGLSEEDAFYYFIQVANAINFLHENNLIHRDIKPENILLDGNNKVKLCDFGWCCEAEIGNRKTFCGTFEYMAPEIIKEEPYNKSIDIWALGILLYEMIYGETPFKADEDAEDKTNEVLTNILSKEIEFKGTNPNGQFVSQECINLITSMIEQNPNKRITMTDLFQHEWVKKYTKKSFQGIFNSDIRQNEKNTKNNEKPTNEFVFRKEDYNTPYSDLYNSTNIQKKKEKPNLKNYYTFDLDKNFTSGQQEMNLDSLKNFGLNEIAEIDQERDREKQKEDELFFDRVIRQVKGKKRKVKRGTSLSKERRGKSKNNETKNMNYNLSMENEAINSKNNYRRSDNYQKGVSKTKKIILNNDEMEEEIKRKQNNFEIIKASGMTTANKFLSELNSQREQDYIERDRNKLRNRNKEKEGLKKEKTEIMNEMDRETKTDSKSDVNVMYEKPMKKPKGSAEMNNLDDLTDAIGLINMNNQAEEELGPEEMQKPKEEESFWDKFLKNFKCGN